MRRKTQRKRRVCGSFYETTNKQWQRETELPDTETRITQAYFIQETINKELDTIIAKQPEQSPIAELIASWKVAENTIPDGLTPLLQTVLSMHSISDIVSRIGWMNRYGIPSPISIYVQGDPRDQTRCRIFIDKGEPRIGISDYWLYPEYAKHRAAYAHYIKSLASILGLPQLLKGYSAERECTRTYLAKDGPNDTITWTELCTKYTTINWTALLTAWGLQESQLPALRFWISSPAFVHHLQSRLEKWSIERWQGWLGLLVAQWIAGCSPQGPLRTAWFQYSRKFLRGLPEDDDAKTLRNDIIRLMMPNTLGRMWVNSFCDHSIPKRVRAMIRNIHDAAKDQLLKTEWMSPSTRKTAIRKLQRMDIEVCWPDLKKWKTKEITCSLVNDDLVSNLLTLGKLTTDYSQYQLISGCDHPYGDEWGRPVYIVNAYYYPSENRFVLPAAILRPPFYDSAKSLAWNYGAIGATIGHELCHAFDSDGRDYDEDGNKRDWWSDHDDREYRKRANRMVQLYETILYRGLPVDGELTLIENISDLGGISFALDGLRRALGREPKRDEMREFFISFSVSWRSKDRLKRAAELLATDMHAPPMLRVNHVVRQMDEWYTAFDIGPDCVEWIAPEHRIRFFGSSA